MWQYNCRRGPHDKRTRTVMQSSSVHYKPQTTSAAYLASLAHSYRGDCRNQLMGAAPSSYRPLVGS